MSKGYPPPTATYSYLPRPPVPSTRAQGPTRHACIHVYMQGQTTKRRRERLSDCARIAAARPYLRGGKQLAPRRLTPRVFFSGAVQTKTRGPGLCAPSPPYSTLTPPTPP